MLRKLLALVGLALVLVGCGAVGSGSGTTSCTLASYNTTPTSGKELGIGLTTLNGTSVAQSFVATAGTAVSASVQLQRVGTFTSGSQLLTATIVADSSGSPSTTAVASGTLDPANISSSAAAYYTITFSSSVALTAGTTYWLRVKASYAVNSTNYVTWSAFDGMTGGYFNGSTALNAVYETNISNTYSTTQIGTFRFLTFTINC